MRILVADDDPVSRQALEGLLANWGYDATTVADGESACGILVDVAAPRLAILDWTMPGLDGAEVCRALRGYAREPYIYILLTAPDAKLDVVRGLEAGADDYLTKPFDPQELKARLRAGRPTRPGAPEFAAESTRCPEMSVCRGPLDRAREPHRGSQLLVPRNHPQRSARLSTGRAPRRPGRIRVTKPHLRVSRRRCRVIGGGAPNKVEYAPARRREEVRDPPIHYHPYHPF
jgi:DNA-binding response OmpR family regulator